MSQEFEIFILANFKIRIFNFKAASSILVQAIVFHLFQGFNFHTLIPIHVELCYTSIPTDVQSWWLGFLRLGLPSVWGQQTVSIPAHFFSTDTVGRKRRRGGCGWAYATGVGEGSMVRGGVWEWEARGVWMT